MRSIFAVAAVALLPVAATSCVATPSSVKSVAPQNAREALVQAEILLIGTSQVAIGLYNSGQIDRDTTRAIGLELQNAAVALDTAHLFLRMGESQNALELTRSVIDTIEPLAARISEAQNEPD